VKTPRTIDDVLLPLGGKMVIHYDTGDDTLIVERGSRYQPKRVVLRPGSPNQCHRNSCAFYLFKYPMYEIVTGYALSGDIWRRHSWLMPRFRQRDTILETTVKADAYFGVRLDDDDTTGLILRAIFPCLPGLHPAVEQPRENPQ
jgi:hypothetical protein